MTIIWKLLTTMVVNFIPWFASRLVFGHPLLYQPYPRLPTVPLLKVARQLARKQLLQRLSVTLWRYS